MLRFRALPRAALLCVPAARADAMLVRESDVQDERFVAGGFVLPEAKRSVSWKDLDKLRVGTDFAPGSMSVAGYGKVAKECKRGLPLADARTVFTGQPGDIGVRASARARAAFDRAGRVRAAVHGTGSRAADRGEARRRTLEHAARSRPRQRADQRRRGLPGERRVLRRRAGLHHTDHAVPHRGGFGGLVARRAAEVAAGAVVALVPLTDMLPFYELRAGASWIGQHRHPDGPADRAFIAKYSPYRNARKQAKYPPPFLVTTTRDERVHPGHARKIAARMIEYGRDVRHFENIEGGHGAAANDAQPARMWARAFSLP